MLYTVEHSAQYRKLHITTNTSCACLPQRITKIISPANNFKLPCMHTCQSNESYTRCLT